MAMMDLEFNWITVLWGLATLVVSFVLGMAVLVAMAVALPANCLQVAAGTGNRVIHPVLRGAWRVGRNVLGLLAIVIGCVLAIPGVPGPGVPIALVGLMLTDVPGKRQLMKRLLAMPGILAGTNALRQRFGRPRLATSGHISS
jgi:hypothetical protein